MKEAIESTLFVDMQLSTLADINYEERNTTLGILNNNGSLTETDFYSLLHSKVFYAYDAARILALTWNVTIDNYTTEELHNFLNQSWKISNSNQSKTLVQKLQQNLFNVVSPYTGLAGSYDFDKNQGKLGSSIVTQFTGGKECIIGYYDSTNSTNLQECDTEFCCNVTWKGSSPILNAIITFGCTLGYANGYLFLANYYIGMTGNGNLKPICNVTVSLFWLSQLLINSTILMKNWRIFRIFHNPSQKNRNNLSNVKLFLGIGVTSAPVIVALTVIQLIKPLEVHQASFKNYHCPGFPDNIEASLVEDHCIVSLTLRWDALILFYIIFLLIIIIFLGSFNCRIPGHFKNEGELAILAGAMTLLLFIVYMAITLVLSNGNPESIMIKDQLAYAGGFVLAYNSFILFALYGSKAILLFRDKKVKPVKRKSTIRRKFSDLHDEIFTLKRQLEKMDASRPIKQLNSSSNLIPNFTFED
uniref:G-protein coupled receptors family 3 profile domain-containing protein n=1 Tax=Amphimedon queenslandica TaxID=400682 RepID=A0A1X7U5X2_AMPQE